MKKLKFIAFSLAVATGAAAGDFTTYVNPFIGIGACDLIDISLFPITGESVSSAFSLLHCIIKGFPDMSTTIIGFPVAFNDLSKSDCRPGNSREERSKPSPDVDLSGERPRNVERVPMAAMTKSLFSAAFKHLLCRFRLDSTRHTLV